MLRVLVGRQAPASYWLLLYPGGGTSVKADLSGGLHRMRTMNRAHRRFDARRTCHELIAMRALVVEHLLGARLRRVAPDDLALSDIGLGRRELGDDFLRQAGHLRDHPGIEPADPVAQAERAVLGIEPIVEGKHRVARRGPQRLDRVAVSLREMPEIPGP